MAGTTIEAVDGVELYVESHGSGKPILFSCGFCTTHENWRSQVAPLVEAGARVMLWDFRAHGRSAVPQEPEAYSLDLVLDDLGRVLEWGCGDEPAVLAGHSFGGLASLHFAARSLERVRGLILMASGPGFKNPDAAARWAAQTERTARYLEDRGLEDFVSGRAGDTCIGRERELPAAAAAAAAIIAQSPSGLAMFGRRISATAPSIIDQLPGLDRPALVLVGGDDAPFLQASEVMAAKLPRARREVLPGVGHVANIEAPEDFNARAIEFLESV